jgi:hypothetical protein
MASVFGNWVTSSASSVTDNPYRFKTGKNRVVPYDRTVGWTAGLVPAIAKPASLPSAKVEVMHRTPVTDEELQLADGRPMLRSSSRSCPS